MISLTFLWKNGTNIANGKFQFIQGNDVYYIAIVWKRGCHDFSSNHFRRVYNSIRLKE